MGVLANLGSWLQPTFSPTKEDHSHVTSSSRRPSSTLRLPHKRTIDDSSSEEISLPSQLTQNKLTGHQNKLSIPKVQPSSRLMTPSPAPSANIEVVIPSPSQRQQKLIKTLKSVDSPRDGSWDHRFPTDAEERQKAALRAYPHARKALRYELNQKLKRISGPEVSLDMDDEQVAMLSANFGFLNEYKLQDGITRADPAFNAGCTCNGPCDPESCDCIEMEEDEDKPISTYRRVHDKIVLGSDFLKRKRHPRILECNEACGCKGKCWNTVVQRGRSVRLQIFDTGVRGLGLCSPDPIVAGQFIDIYLGEVISKKEADARENTDEKNQSYLFTLDHNRNDGAVIAEYGEDFDDFYVVDGQKFGSPTRFMNHSCNPNCIIAPPKTELTFDYNPNWDGNNKIDPNAVQCLCGERNCRGQLWPNARKKGRKV
ncbi:histone H3 methyltransferase SUV39H1/Clr4 [Penicillium maclennaniae]|uniref:histone H3 methyltransferase SUV39H1/Clr4 n=1 Tax=Penicillium maclennaniae TaxID=1343394 RepID=UPI0025404AA7|nr:histone H3 methyltransferase SUV39H1/Clr4 [Penicillium maclennaniae]KAJ5677180.1 histone H3 methyltransferase SUV39H1/Clr4 [Penicillium maclennaniae]